MALEFGLFSHLERSSGSASLNELYSEHLDFLVEAEQADFWGFHLAEHHATPLSTTPSPALFLAAASQRTKRRIRLGGMVFLLPFYQPLRLVNEIAMLDNLTNGRLEVGVGRGISPFEHAYFGNPILETHEIFADALAVLVKGLTSERLTHHGSHYRYHDVPIVIQPLQKPYPGLWYGASFPEPAAYAGQHRMNTSSRWLSFQAAWLLRRQLGRSGGCAGQSPGMSAQSSGPRSVAEPAAANRLMSGSFGLGQPCWACWHLAIQSSKIAYSGGPA